MTVTIKTVLMILVALANMTGNAQASDAERDCPMVEARHITSVRVTLTGFGDRDQYGKTMQVNGTWDLLLSTYNPDSVCDWSTTTPSGHTISLTVLDGRHFQGGGFFLSVVASTGGIQAESNKALSAGPYGNWRMKPVSGVTAGTARVSEAVIGMKERPAAASTKYVAADIARLREGPSAEGGSLLRLRVNSPLEILETKSPWLKVIALGAFTGWIREELVLDRPLTAEEAWQRAAASAGEERLGWLERTVAVDPSHASAWSALRDSYAAAGKKDRAKAIERLLSGRDRFFIAECFNHMAELRVVYAPDGSFLKLGRERDGILYEEALTSLADEVTAWPWYAIIPKSAVLLPGTPFPLPQADTEGQTVRLGRCPDGLEEGEVMTTAPFVWERLKAEKGGRYVFTGGSGLKLQIKGGRKEVSWTVLGRDDKPLRRRDGTAATWSSSAECEAAFTPGNWYRNRLSGIIYGTVNYGWSCCGEGDGECGSEDSEWLTVIFPTEGMVDSVYNFKGGC